MNGNGILYYQSGGRFEGIFVDDHLYIGIMYFPDGSRIEGEWENGNITGCLVMPDGRRIESSESTKDEMKLMFSYRKVVKV